MAGKQLPIIVKASDQASQVINLTARNVNTLGQKSVKASKDAEGAFSKLFKRLTSLKTLVGGLVAALAVRRIASGIVQTAQELDRLAKTSLRLDVPVEKLSELKFVADRQGVAFEGMATAYKTANKNLGELVATGNGEARDAVQLLNLELRDSRGRLRDVLDLLPDVAEGMKGLSPAEQAFAANKLFGRQGFEMLTVLKLSREELARLQSDARRYGAVITAGQAQAAERMVDSLSNLRAAWTRVKAAIIEEIEPSVTASVNRMADGIAQIPRFVGNVAFIVRQTLGGGEFRDVIVEKLGGVWDAVRDATVEAIGGIGRVAFVTMLATADTMLRVAAPYVSRRVAAFVSETWAEGQIAAMRALEGLPWFGERLKLLADVTEMERQVRGIRDSLADPGDAVRTFNDELSFSPQWVEAFTAAIEDMRQGVTPAVQDVGQRIGDLLLLVERLRGLTATGQVVPPGPEEAARVKRWWDDLVGGIGDGIADIKRQTADVRQFVRQSTTQIAGAIAGGVSGALLDAVQGVKSFGDAMRQMLANTLRMVADLILQFLILRAIAGIAGSFGGGSSNAGGLGPGVHGPVYPGATGGLVGRHGVIPAYAHGGQVMAVRSAALAGVPWYDAGGLLGGARMHRDSQLLLGMPGEYMVSRRGVAASGVETLARGNRGERLVPARDAGGVSVNVTVNVSGGGGGGSPQAVARVTRKAVMEAVLEGIAQSPAARQRLRAALR